MYTYLAIEVNIGVGKTGLAGLLAERFQQTLIREEFAGNSFLEKVYREKERYAFPVEISFLVERYQQLLVNIPVKDLFRDKFISDYCFDKSLVFARNNLDRENYKLFQDLFGLFSSRLPQPDFILYLHKPVEELQENIKKRGRKFEKYITAAYLKDIQKSYLHYLKHLRNKRVIIADVTGVNFLQEQAPFEKIVELCRKDHPGKLQIIDI